MTNHLTRLADPGAWAEAIAHSPCLRVEEYEAREDEPPCDCAE